MSKEDKMIADIRSPLASETYESPQLRDLIGRSDYGMLVGKQRLKWAINLPVGVASNNFVNEIIKLRARTGQVLVIVPDEKDILALKNGLKDPFDNSFLVLCTHL